MLGRVDFYFQSDRIGSEDIGGVKPTLNISADGGASAVLRKGEIL